MTSPPLRYDYFQTATQVVVSVYVKGVTEEQLNVRVEEQSLTVDVQGRGSVVIARLFAPVDATNAGVRCVASKVEISLQKAQPGLQWPALQGGEGEAGTAAAAAPASMPAAPSTAAPPRRSKWDSFVEVDEEEMIRKHAGGSGDGGDDAAPLKPEDASIDAFFRKLYEQADDDTKRAMMKSFTESNGTALSTNWEEVRKAPVETRPPDGVEAKRWGA